MKGLKTMIIAIALAVFGALEAFDFTAYLDATNAGYAVTGVGFVMGLLRLITTTPIGKSE